MSFYVRDLSSGRKIELGKPANVHEFMADKEKERYALFRKGKLMEWSQLVDFRVIK